MIVHIFNDQKKFSLGFFRFLRDSGFDLSSTRLWHYGKKSEDYAACGVDASFIRSWFWPFGHLRMYRDLKKADRIIVHSLASPFLIAMLRFNRKLCARVWWVIWGKDLYLYQLSEKKSLPLKLYESFRRPVIRDIAHIISTLPGDYALAQQWYGVRADYTPCPMLYPYSSDYGSGAPAKTAEGKLTLLLGNSASLTNDHLPALPVLAGQKEKFEKVYCPLSYGGPRKYAEKVAAAGREQLGPVFEPLMDFIPYERYRNIWDSADVAVYNHRRQEALGNIYSLILMKKTVYLRPSTSTAAFMASAGIVTPAFTEGCEIAELPAAVREKNAEILYEYLRPERSRETWARVLMQEGAANRE